jgi:hypothetical protein
MISLIMFIDLIGILIGGVSREQNSSNLCITGSEVEITNSL